jgi:polysaccharide biosynthesis transport protein
MKALTGSISGVPLPVVERRPNRLRSFVQVLARRRLVILRTTVVIVAIAALVCVLITRRYTATAEIQVQQPQASSLGSDGATGSATVTDPNSSRTNLETQTTVLTSPAMAIKVIEDLHLEAAAAFRPHFTLSGWITSLVSPPPTADPPGATLETSPRRRDRMLKQFSDGLDVHIVPGTRVIEIAYSCSDPNVAAQVVNHLVDSLQQYSAQAGSAEVSQASKWLEAQLADLKQQTDALQAKLIQLQRATGAVEVAGNSGDETSHGQAYSSTVDELQKDTDAVAQAQNNRILKGAIYEVVKSGNPETIMGLPQNAALAGAVGGMTADLATMSNLRTQEATINAQISDLMAKFGAAYPKVDELKAEKAAIETSIHEEIQRMSDRARNEYVVAQHVEDGAKRAYETERLHANEVNDKTVQYELVRQQYQQSRDLYDKLLGRLKEAGAMQGFHSNSIQVVSAAFAPSLPSVPNVPLYMGGSVVAGVFLGCIMAFLIDAMDTRIGDIHSFHNLLGHSPFGILPAFTTTKRPLHFSGYSVALPPGESIAALKHPHSAYVEALRALRTTLLSTRGGPPPQVVLITSSLEGEGKSTLSANLAVVLAQQGKRVLLVDSDLRRPNLHVLFDASTEVGLSSVLAGKLAPDAIDPALTRLEQAPSLDVLMAGPIPAFSAELLGSSKMKRALDLWRRSYDFVILDGAPVLPVTDSVVLSAFADTTLLVARHQNTPQQSLELSIRTLRAQLGSNHHIGVVLNGVELKTDSYYKYYGYANNAQSGKRLGGGSEAS